MTKEVTFTADEIKVLRFLEKQYLEIGGEPDTMDSPVTKPQQVRTECGLNEPTFRKIMARLEALGIAKMFAPDAPNGWVRISSTVVDLVHQFNNPPTKDYWADLKEWALSKRWFIPVMLLGVAVPWATGIILGLKIILEWFGGGD